MDSRDFAHGARGLCHVAFIEPRAEAAALDEPGSLWPKAHRRRDDAGACGRRRTLWSGYRWGAERKPAMLAWRSLRGRPECLRSARIAASAAVVARAAGQPT